MLYKRVVKQHFDLLCMLQHWWASSVWTGFVYWTELLHSKLQQRVDVMERGVEVLERRVDVPDLRVDVPGWRWMHRGGVWMYRSGVWMYWSGV